MKTAKSPTLHRFAERLTDRFHGKGEKLTGVLEEKGPASRETQRWRLTIRDPYDEEHGYTIEAVDRDDEGEFRVYFWRHNDGDRPPTLILTFEVDKIVKGFANAALSALISCMGDGRDMFDESA